jgi:2,4-dienoyl-CoA reductase (NADPH2)
MKISAVEHNDALAFLKFEGAGNVLADSIQVCRWLEEAGVDSIHVSTGSSFPHPRNPAGADFPVDVLASTYEQLASSGETTFRNLLLFRGHVTGEIFKRSWLDAGVPADRIEGANLPDARAIKKAVSVPVICTGGFQTASVIRDAINRGDCDAVSAARPLVANNDLVKQFAAGRDTADRPCTYCNKCLVHVVEHPIGCYEESRFNSREQMIDEIMSVFRPSAFS